MGTYYSIACYDCKVFLDCGRVIPFRKASAALFAMFQPEYFEDGGQLSAEVMQVEGMYAYPVTSSDLIEELAQTDPHFPYTGEYKPPEQLLAEGHRGHRLYVFMDLGDRPWVE